MPHTDNSSGTIRVGLGALTKEKLGCRSHMFESSFFSALCAYKKLLELCAGAPNRHFLRRLLVQLGWLAGCSHETYTPRPLSNALKYTLLKAKNCVGKSYGFTLRCVLCAEALLGSHKLAKKADICSESIPMPNP